MIERGVGEREAGLATLRSRMTDTGTGQTGSKKTETTASVAA
jgi:hypothetical protein